MQGEYVYLNTITYIVTCSVSSPRTGIYLHKVSVQALYLVEEKIIYLYQQSLMIYYHIVVIKITSIMIFAIALNTSIIIIIIIITISSNRIAETCKKYYEMELFRAFISFTRLVNILKSFLGIMP
jgi:hypothetical protein